MIDTQQLTDELHKCLAVLERVDYSPDAEIEMSMPFAVGFCKSAIRFVLMKIEAQREASQC